MYEKYLERARAYRAIEDPHHNCTQTVLMTFAPEAGLSAEDAFKVAKNFGGGMKVGAMCGAITGSLMAMGLLGCTDEQRAEFMEIISTAYGGDVDCAVLLRKNVEEPGKEKKPFCDGLIYTAVETVCKVMKIE